MSERPPQARRSVASGNMKPRRRRRRRRENSEFWIKSTAELRKQRNALGTVSGETTLEQQLLLRPVCLFTGSWCGKLGGAQRFGRNRRSDPVLERVENQNQTFWPPKNCKRKLFRLPDIWSHIPTPTAGQRSKVRFHRPSQTSRTQWLRRRAI